VFALVAGLLIDGLFYFLWRRDSLEAAPLVAWDWIKAVVLVAGLAWIAYATRSAAMAMLTVVFAIIGLEDLVGVTVPLGMWLIQETGVRHGPQGTNTQLLRRGVVAIALVGPTLYLAWRVPPWLRKATWMLIVLLAALFVGSVLGGVLADRSGSNVDELVEEPLITFAAALVVGLVVELGRRRTAANPTKPSRR